MNWSRFVPSEIEYDFDGDKLEDHALSYEEACECFDRDFQIRKNKGFKDRYQLIGHTVAGRRLKIIFQLKSGNVVRIITGWPI